jgi:cold shock CspA family protein
VAQGTIKTFDPKTRTGIVLDDAKNEYGFDEQSYRPSGIRELRLGQRVKFALEGTPPKVRDLTIVSF